MARVQVEPYFDNTTQEAYYSDTDGRLMSYVIAPAAGYVIHDNKLDEEILEAETGMPTGEVRIGYTGSLISVGRTYNFKENPRDIYAVPRSEVDEKAIDGGTGV